MEQNIDTVTDVSCDTNEYIFTFSFVLSLTLRWMEALRRAYGVNDQCIIKMMDDVVFCKNCVVSVLLNNVKGAICVYVWLYMWWELRRNLSYTLHKWVEWRCGVRGPEHARQFPRDRWERTKCPSFKCISKWEGLGSPVNR